MIIGGKFCASRVPFSNGKLKHITINMSCLRQLDVPFSVRSVSLSFESHVQCEAKNRRRWKSELTVQTCRSAMRTLEANKHENLCAWIIEVWLGSNTYRPLNLLLPRWSSSLQALAFPLSQMTADEPEEGEFEFGEEGRFQKSHLRLHCRLWYR